MSEAEPSTDTDLMPSASEVVRLIEVRRRARSFQNTLNPVTLLFVLAGLVVLGLGVLQAHQALQISGGGLMGLGLLLILPTIKHARASARSMKTLRGWVDSGTLDDLAFEPLEPGDPMGSVVITAADDQNIAAVSLRGEPLERAKRIVMMLVGVSAAVGAIGAALWYLHTQPGGIRNPVAKDLRVAMALGAGALASLTGTAYAARSVPLAWSFFGETQEFCVRSLVWGLLIRDRAVPRSQIQGVAIHAGWLSLELVGGGRIRLTQFEEVTPPTHSKRRGDRVFAAFVEWWARRVLHHASLVLSLDPISADDTRADQL